MEGKQIWEGAWNCTEFRPVDLICPVTLSQDVEAIKATHGGLEVEKA